MQPQTEPSFSQRHPLVRGAAQLCAGAASLLLGSAVTGCSAADAPESTAHHAEEIILSLNRFQHQVVATGLSQPTAMQFAPDGRIFVAQQGGQVRIVKNGSLLAQPFATLSVDSVNERGLIGLTLDPNFGRNGYVYVFYTTPNGGTHNRVSRLTANGDFVTQGSEIALVDFPALSAAGNHNSGALHFGNDGKLYVAHGDNADIPKSQDLSHPFGSVLRFNADGTIPTDNPFYGSSTGLARAIWAYGLRNTFTFAVQASTGNIYGNDVGGDGPEEINHLIAGGNFGHGGGPAPIGPVYSYPRNSGRCAITGGTFYEPRVPNFPAYYTGKYFFSDYCSGQIWFMNANGTGVTLFAEHSGGELNSPVDLDVGPDGALYYLQRSNGAKIGRIFNPEPHCNTNAACDDRNPCTTDACSGQVCQNTDNGSCSQCIKVRSQRTGNYLAVNEARQVVSGATQSAAEVLEQIPVGGGYSFKGSRGDYLRVVANNLILDASAGSASAFLEYDCSSGGTRPGGKGFASLAGAGPHWQATAAGGPIKSGDGGSRTSCVNGTGTSWERFYAEVVTCPGGNGAQCGDGMCGVAENCSTCAVDCGACCGDGTCSAQETCSSCQADCGACTGTPEKLTLTHVSNDGGWNSIAGLTDGNTTAKHRSGSSPNCVAYELDGPHTITSARLLEDNAGTWNVATWKIRYGSGSGFSDAIDYTATPSAMPAWNDLDFSDVSGVTEVAVCMTNPGGAVEVAELELFGFPSSPVCGDGNCTGAETCGTCATDCGTCDATPERVALTLIGSSGGWSSAAGLADGDLVTKVSSATTPNCAEYSLPGTFTLTSARVLEDNQGSWHVDSWKLQVDTGNGFTDAFANAGTPNAMPLWNEVDFPDVSGVRRINVCVQNTGGAVELAELEVWGHQESGPICGDWVCDGSESCAECPWDCNTCGSGTAGLDSRPSNPQCLAGTSASAPSTLLSQSPCVVSVANPPVFSAGVIPYSVAAPFWSDGADKARYLALPDGAAFDVQADGDWTMPPGAVTIKNFLWQGQYVETRFFVRYTDGSYGAWTYRWNDAQTEAFLVDSTLGESTTLPGGHVWSYPTQAQCFECHTEAAGFSLGLETRQLNVEQLYPATGRVANQFETLDFLGMLSGAESLPPLPTHDDTAVALQMRAEAYLHVNCSNCHRPGGPGYGTANYLYDTPFADMNVCRTPSILNAFPELPLIEPGDHTSSVVWLRMSQRDANFMPPLGSSVADADGAAFLAEWIDDLDQCPATQ